MSLPAEFTQVKWHVDQSGSYGLDELLAVPVGGKTSILQKLHASKMKLAHHGAVELQLLSNWGAHEDFGKYLEATTDRLGRNLFVSQSRAEKTVRKRVCEALGIELLALEEFCKVLKFRLGFGSITELEKRVDERMRNAGLLTGSNARSLATDRVSKWIEEGGRSKQVDRAGLLREIDDLALRAPVGDEPTVSLHVHGWVRTEFGRPCTIEIDWTAHFDRQMRKVGNPRHWHEVLLPQLSVAAGKLRSTPGGMFVDVQSKAPLTANLAVGFALSEAAGFTLKTDQITTGSPQRWSTRAPASDLRFRINFEEGAPGPRILIGIQVSAPMVAELRRFAAGVSPAFDAIACLEPQTGSGETALRGESDAVALAVNAKQLIRGLRRKFQSHEVHLVLCCPAALALFLGHRLNAMGTVVLYERTNDGSYVEALHLHTG